MKRILLIILGLILYFVPIISSVYAEDEESLNPPTINSEAAVVIDAKSGDILFSKNSNQSMYPASITKIATAIYAIEHGDLEEIVTVSKRARNADGTRVYLEEGEIVPLKKLIQGMVINSGNDAAIAIAEHISGSVEQFSKDINLYLKEKVGVQNTHFVNPSGLFDENHQTTAEDMAIITKYALNNEIFKEIFKTEELPWNGQSWNTTIYNHHKLLISDQFPEVTGGKTGYVDESGHTLVTTAEKDGLSIIVVTLKANGSQLAYQDTINLMNYCFSNFETDQIKQETEFENAENEKFKVKETIYFTKRIGEETNPIIDKNGMLTIIGERDRVIKTIPLKKVEEKLQTEKSEKKINQNGLSNHYSLLLLFSFLISFVLTGFFIMDARKL